MRRRGTRFAALSAASALVMGAAGWTGSGSALAAKPVPGLTPTTVTIGNVAVLTGPVPGLFAGAVNGLDAYAAYINSKGGVDGRKILVKSADDGFSCATNVSQTQALSSQIFAFVGNFSVYDQCGATVLKKEPTVPDVSFGLSDAVKNLPNNFSPQPAPPGYRTGAFEYVKQRYPKAVTKMAALYGIGSNEEFSEQTHAAESVGYKVVYSRGIAPTETSFTSDIIRMRNSGVQMLYMTDLDYAEQGQILDAAAQQNWKPKVVLLESAYDPNFFKIATPAAADGALFDEQFALFQGEDAKAVPEVRLFLEWMKKTHPTASPDLYAMYSWTAAALFVQALRDAGKNPTQAGVLAALKKIHRFTDNGMLAPADVGAKKPPTCYLVGKITGGKWVRTSPAKSGFRCSPGGYYYGK